MTRAGFAGYGLKPVGSFAGKPESIPEKGIITRPGFAGYGVKRTGSFAGKLATTGGEDYYLPHANNFFDTNVRGYT